MWREAPDEVIAGTARIKRQSFPQRYAQIATVDSVGLAMTRHGGAPRKTQNAAESEHSDSAA